MPEGIDKKYVEEITKLKKKKMSKFEDILNLVEL